MSLAIYWKRIVEWISSGVGRQDVEAGVEGSSASCTGQIANVLRQAECKWILLLLACNSVLVYYLWSWSACSESLALRAYANALAFNVMALAVCLISIWVEQNTGRTFAYSDEDRRVLCKSRPGCSNRLGVEKYEVFGLLGSSSVCLLAQALLLLDALARIALQQPVLVHEGRLGLGAVVGVVAHLVTIVVYPDAGLNHVVCKALPCPSFNNAINPILAANLISFSILCGSHFTIHFWQLYVMDIAAAFAVIALSVGCMLPLAFYTLSIILQKISHHMSEQLDRCLQEALVIDGVLEFRNERFWTKSFGKLSGSLEVRIRKNADENYVLGKVIARLSQVVSTLSVKEFREPINLANNLMAGLPFEYYLDELLQTKLPKETEKQQTQDIQTGNVVKIQDVLRSDGALTSCADRQTEKLYDKQPGVSNAMRNWQKPRSTKDFHPKLPVRNALLLGSRCDLEDLHCTARLYCQ